ncbi:MAG: GNAT family N-acetyltransferase [Acholeplasmatales bacterium]|nr:MAG: GNAT family N-acetyltransferase [Acholeplasmatales bacterium]
MHVVIAETKQALLDHFRIRGEVFIVEQAIDWTEEFDADDYHATLFVLYEGNQAIGAARLNGYKVGRVAVLKTHRHKHAGRMLMSAVEAHARQCAIDRLELGAQLPVIPFYEKLGYQAYGDIFLDADIEHRMMAKDL